MAGSRKEYELLFKLQAALGGNFNAVFKGAINTTRQLQNTMQKLNSTTGKIDAFQKQSTALESNRQKLERLTAEHDRLQRELSQTEQPSEKLRAAMERNERQIADTTAKIEAQEARLRTLGDELSDAGVDTPVGAGKRTSGKKLWTAEEQSRGNSKAEHRNRKERRSYFRREKKICRNYRHNYGAGSGDLRRAG